MVKILYNTVCCGVKQSFKVQLKKIYKASEKNKISLINKIVKCKKCDFEYKVKVIEGYSNVIDVVYDNNHTLELDKEKFCEVIYTIGEYDRGVQDELYWAEVLDAEFEQNEKEEREKKLNTIKVGHKGETKFINYLNKHQCNFIYLDQERETFSKAFYNQAKRPDFLILDNNHGNKFIDVKNYTLYNNNIFRIYLEDYRKLLKLMEISSTQTYYGYIKKNDFSTWYFIDIKEVEKIYNKLKPKEKNKDFIMINIDKFSKCSYDSNFFAKN